MIQHSADQTLKMRSCEELIKAAALTAASNGSWQGGRKQKTRKIQSKSSKPTTTRSHLEQIILQVLHIPEYIIILQNMKMVWSSEKTLPPMKGWELDLENSEGT